MIGKKIERLIAAAHVKSLLTLPMINKESATALRALINRTQSNLKLLTLQRGVTSTARHSENITRRRVTSTARHAALSHSFDYISTT